MPRRKSTHVDNPVEVGRRLREARERAGSEPAPALVPGLLARIHLPHRGGRPHSVAPAPARDGQAPRRQRGLPRDRHRAPRRERRPGRGRDQPAPRRARGGGEAVRRGARAGDDERRAGPRARRPRAARLPGRKAAGGDRPARGGPHRRARRARRPPGLGRHARPRLRVGRPARRRDQPLRELAQVGRGAQRRGRGHSLRGAARERADRQDGLRRRRAAARPDRGADLRLERPRRPRPPLLVAVEAAPQRRRITIGPPATRGTRSTCSS